MSVAHIVGPKALRFAVALAVLCAITHATLVILGGERLLSMTAPMLLLSMVCAACGLCGPGRPGGWESWVTAAGGSAMVTIHLLTLHSASASMFAMPPSLELVSHVGVTLAATQAALVAVAALAATAAERERLDPQFADGVVSEGQPPFSATTDGARNL